VLYFFLSYAREDDPEFIRRFFHDLSSQVRNLAGVGQADTVGFLDEQNVQIGQRWSAEMTNALATCRCFVAMTSPRYFRRDYCGREWYVFNDRLDMYLRQHGLPAPALLPVRWIPTDPMHPIADPIQNAHAATASRSYLEFGLRQMLDLKRFRDDYVHFVFELARRILAVARDHEVPVRRRPLQLDSVPNIFADEAHDAITVVAAGPARPRRARSGRRTRRTFVHFVVVTGSRDEMATLRGKLDYYGETAAHWRPYYPSTDEHLSNVAHNVALDRQFECAVADIEDLGERIDGAVNRNELVVLLVDAWSPGLATHRQALVDYDAREEVTSAVMIPFNTADTETLSETTILQADLANVLRRTVERRDRVMLRQNVPTPEQFYDDLEEILEVGKNRMFKIGKVNPQLPDRPSRARPILEGPTD
jgi:FxsC-like protein